MKTLTAMVLVGMAGICGCNTPPKDPPADVPVGTGVASASTPAPSASAPTATASVVASASAAPSPSTSTSTSTSTTKPTVGKGCATDADCRTHSSYCAEAPCACRVLAKTDGDPKCLGSGPKVNCFVDPCMKKAARCQGGACVLTAKGATEK